MKKSILFIILVISFNLSFSQNNLAVSVEGLKVGDSALIILQDGVALQLKKWAKNTGENPVILNFNLDARKWALIIDATGYTFPSATYINVPEVNQAQVTLTPLLNQNYIYSWEDDDSYAGHATQVYVNEPSKWVVLNDTITVPTDYSSIKLRDEYRIILSNDKSFWSSEDSYRLYSMLKTLPLQSYWGGNEQAIFYLTEEEQYKDISIVIVDGIKHVTVSQAAFTYANPQIGNLDGIKVKFYSKRLNHALLNYYTDFGSNIARVNEVALNRYGVRFMQSDQETETIMGEDASNFQEFFNEEKIEILAMFEEMPEGFHKIKGLKYLVRRINGQVDPIMPGAVAIAFSGRNTIEFMSTAFNQVDIDNVRRIILHEKAHFLWELTFDEQTRNDWIELGGWFLDPTTTSGWSTYNTTEFVSAYAHDVSPNEDMAESIAAYITNPDILISRSMRKYEFIRDRIMHGTRYIAQIREDLTFTVYNLFPDYIYPGKVIGLDIEVTGAPEEDKEVTIRVRLHSTNVEFDGANMVYLRVGSSINTVHDISLTPEDGSSLGSVLVGKTTFSKFEKNGYWDLQFLRVFDLVANQRYENTSTIGFKLYLENPLEDVTPPKWNYDIKMEVVNGKFLPTNTTFPDDINGVEMNAIKINYSIYDDIPVESVLSIMNPTLDDPNAQVYERWIGATVILNDTLSNGFKSNKYLQSYVAIPDYYPSGYYSASRIVNSDIARNSSNIFFVKDTTNFVANNFSVFKEVRDSIYVSTLYPDYIAPEIDINNINIIAQPINPIAPDGETRVDVDLLARDLSDFIGKESGIVEINFTLRDPLGILHGYNTGNSTMNHPQLDQTRSDFLPDNNSDWRSFNFNLVLPQGSPPGKWGISSMQAVDKAGNFRNYSFVEYIRFDVIESNIVLEEPLVAQILNKYVNAESVNSISISITCKPSAGLRYIYTVYSLMGGNVVRGEGTMSTDSLTINNINLTGVLDGVIKLTVQLLDGNDQLIATTTTDYTKDTVLPKAFYSRSNLQNDGVSSLDAFVLNVVVEKVDVGGTYQLDIQNLQPQNKASKIDGIAPTEKISNKINNLNISGIVTSEDFSIGNLDLSNLSDGYLSISLFVTDPFENKGEEQISYYYLKDNSIRKVESIAIDDIDSDGIPNIDDNCPDTPIGEVVDANGCSTSQLDTDNDGVKDNLDTCPNTPSGQTVNANGCATSQLDTDNDGIKDNLDTCPNTPSGQTVNATGCSQSQLDDDGDGIMNDKDLCPNTATGTNVNANGCFFLPANNFSIEAVGESCPDKNNGKISITAQATHNYVATINGVNHNFANNSLSVSNLSPGTYNVCIKITGVIYEQCFTITIAEGKTVSGKSSVISNKASITIDKGTAPYNVLVNGINVLNTESPSFTFDVRHGDLVEVKTAVLCEGVFSKSIDLFENIKAYPNPTKGVFEITLPLSLKEVVIELYSVGSQLLSKGTYQVVNGKVQLNLENKPTGIYVVKIYLDTPVSLTIIKE